MNEGTITVKNTFDSRAWKFDLLMLFSFYLLMAAMVIIGNRLIITIIIGLLCLIAFYTTVIVEIKRTPTIAELTSLGMILRFKTGRSSFFEWNNIIGWNQIKAAGKDSFVGIRMINNKMYRFDKEAAMKIKDRYLEVNGKPLKELTVEDILALRKRPMT